MSYCRWSSNDFRCDVYVYGAVGGGFQIHVATRRIVYKAPIPPEVPLPDSDEGPEFDAWQGRLKTMNRMRDEADRVKIGLPHDGETFSHETPGECADQLEALRTLGYIVPQYAIDQLRREQSEVTEGGPIDTEETL